MLKTKGFTKEEYIDFWLETHGGRILSDLRRDVETKELYVIMKDSNGLDTRVYVDIPKKFKTLSDVKLVDKVLMKYE